MLFIEDRVIQQFVPFWSEQRFDLPKYLYWGCVSMIFFFLPVEVGFYCEISMLFFFSIAF